jgi:hypothetical protein
MPALSVQAWKNHMAGNRSVLSLAGGGWEGGKRAHFSPIRIPPNPLPLGGERLQAK